MTAAKQAVSVEQVSLARVELSKSIELLKSAEQNLRGINRSKEIVMINSVLNNLRTVNQLLCQSY